jgi:hypothetical protein
MGDDMACGRRIEIRVGNGTEDVRAQTRERGSACSLRRKDAGVMFPHLFVAMRPSVPAATTPPFHHPASG